MFQFRGLILVGEMFFWFDDDNGGFILGVGNFPWVKQRGLLGLFEVSVSAKITGDYGFCCFEGLYLFGFDLFQ